MRTGAPAGASRRSVWRTAPVVLPRLGVLLALAAATIFVPLAGSLSASRPAPVDVVAVELPSGFPTAYDVLASPAQQTTPTNVLPAVPVVDRTVEVVSRSFERDPLPGCDGQARQTSENGRIPASDLCELWDSDQALRGDAAVSASELNRGFRAAFGRDICLTDSYRSLSEQVRVAAVKPGLAATPGTSNHGWGLAIDLCNSEVASQSVISWLSDNGPTYGWDNPDWARRGGSGKYEPWHWEYVPGTTALGTDYSS